MSFHKDDHRCFGKPEGIEKRLSMWASGLGADKKYPWVGMGLIDDLKCASRMLGGDPDKINADMRMSMRTPKPTFEPVLEPAEESELVDRINTTPNLQPTASTEYDL